MYEFKIKNQNLLCKMYKIVKIIDNVRCSFWLLFGFIIIFNKFCLLYVYLCTILTQCDKNLPIETQKHIHTHTQTNSCTRSGKVENHCSDCFIELT